MKMRVLHIGPKNFPPAHGGVEKSIYDLVTHFEGVESFVAVEWDQPNSGNTIVLPKGLLRRARELEDFVAKRRVDILHFNKEGFIPLALWFFLARRARVVLTIRGCAWRLRKWSLPIRIAFYLLDLAACLLLPRVVFVGRRDFDHFAKLFPWRQFYFIPNGVMAHNFRTRGGAGRFVFVGRISEEKNLLRLVNWFNGSQAELTIFGPIDGRNGEYAQRVLSAIDKSRNVRYGGALPHTQLFDTLAQFGAFINPSCSEGMPVSVLEAASVGLTLVLSDIRQHRDLGFPDAIYVSPVADTVPDLERVGGYSHANVAVVEERYSLSSTCARYEDLYTELTRRS